MKKILIIGDAGRGKTTLAEQISKKLNIPQYSLDDVYWEVKFTKRRDESERLQRALDIYENNSWIVEGDNTKLFKGALNKADHIIHLVYPSILVQWWRVVKREISRENTNFKEFFIFLRHIFYKRYRLSYKKEDATREELLEPYADKVIKLRSFKEINNFVDTL